MIKRYYCPKCKRKIDYDRKYSLVCCVRCGEEMFIIEDGRIKDEYKVEVKSNGN